MCLFMPLLTHILKVVLLLVLKNLFPGFFLTQKTNRVPMHIDTFFDFFFIKKIAYEHFGTSKFLKAIVKQAVVDFHLII